jgi:glycosyltransferase involved in cell wall biosynthesis
MKKKLNIICPVFNEEECIPNFFERIENIKSKLDNYEIELFFSNNCSTDKTYEIIMAICSKNKWVNLITLTRNFGYQGSVFGSLKETNADLYFIVDVDLQDPPELLFDLLKKYEEGDHQVIFGERSDRDENFFIKLFRDTYYRTLAKIADQDFQIDMAEFFLITDDVKQAILKTNSTNIFIRNEVAYSGFKRVGVKYKREKRKEGSGEGESLIYMTLFGFAGIISSSTFPLRLIFYSFFPLLVVDLLYILNFFSLKLITTLNLIYVTYSLAFIAIYIARIYKDSMSRPSHIVDKKKTTLKIA